MEEDQLQLKHTCKFCSKSFPCGRSLGGHMRSHLITVDRKSDDHNLPKRKKTKKLPPLIKTDVFVEGGIMEHPNKALRLSKASEGDTLLEEKLCKECGKSFQSWKALFGHMKCHSLNNFAKAVEEEDSWISCSDDHNKFIMDSQSLSDDDDDEEEASTPLMWKRKRSNRTKRYTSSATNSSSNLSIENSEIDHDQQQEEEVALSLILLSRNHTATNRDLLESSKNPKKIKDHAPRKGLLKKIRKNDHGLKISENKIGHADNEAEVNSPKNFRLIDHFDSEKTRKFICIICKKGFNSYQALGGHRASHKKFKGCCDPTTSENENSRKLIENINNVVEKKLNKDHHECPICFRVFQSGQALGGHKRSHLINGTAENQAKLSTNSSSSVSVEKKVPENRKFLDLNLPAPDEEEEDFNELKPWWSGTRLRNEPVLGLLSSS